MKRDWAGIFLTFWLIVVFTLSGLYMVLWPAMLSNQEAHDYRVMQYDPSAEDVANVARSRLAREINPVGSAPICFVLSAGFLAVLRQIQVSARRSKAEGSMT